MLFRSFRYGSVGGAVAVILRVVGPLWWALLLGGMHGRVRRLSQVILDRTAMPPVVEHRVVEVETAWPWRTA